MATPFFYHPRMLAYDFGPWHPLRPERVRRAIDLARAVGFVTTDPGQGEADDVLRVHAPEYVEAVASWAPAEPPPAEFGFGAGDNPAFEGMHEAALTYVGGSVAAAHAVKQGASLAINLSGGLHHARRSEASGFCIYNDPAIALHILLEKFAKVAYVDIDVHHGDGVQWLWFDDPRAMTCSIHQDGRTLYPGTGAVEETGAERTSVNVPLPPGTTGDVWLWAFERVIIEALKRFRPEAIVLQMGTDAHFADPLARLRVTSQEWTEAVRLVRDLGVPIVAVGGGGYNPTTVPRMWVAACLTLAGREVPSAIPVELQSDLGVAEFFDPPPTERDFGRSEAEAVIRWHELFGALS